MQWLRPHIISHIINIDPSRACSRANFSRLKQTKTSLVITVLVEQFCMCVVGLGVDIGDELSVDVVDKLSVDIGD